jgi:small subunit ribosomal protein S1
VPATETLTEPATEAPQAPPTNDLMIEVDGKLVPNYAATIKPFEEGEVVSGEVVRIDKDEVLVDIGYKSEGVIPSHELSIRRSVDPAEEVSLGEQVDALVLTKEDQEGRLILSKKRARFEKAWRKIEAAAETGDPVEGSVIEVVKGGLILDLGVRGFLPASLVDIRRVHNLDEFKGQTLECKVIELNRSRNNVVLSRRAVLEEERKEVREQILERLQPGQIVEGKISNIVDFGAFVDLEGIDGLIHISELSWSHVNHPSEVLEIGQDVRVKVLDIDRDRQRISLGLKQTQEDPWQKVLNEYKQGDVLEGKVTKVVAFGAFIEIVPGVEGLVHISELAEHHVETPGEVVTPGEEKWVRILEIDEERRRISLSIKRAETGNTAFSDLIPDELKQQAQAAREEDAAAAGQPEEPPVTGGADVPDLGLSEEVFAEAPPAETPDEAPPAEEAPPADQAAPAEGAPADEAPPADEEA